MASRVDKLEREALELTDRERSRLAERLLASVAAEGAGNIEAAWVEEAVRRDREMSEGEVEGIAADEVFRGR